MWSHTYVHKIDSHVGYDSLSHLRWASIDATYYIDIRMQLGIRSPVGLRLDKV